jgi:hypothetical protein
MATVYTIKQGVTLPSIAVVLEDDSGDPLPLSGASVTFSARRPYRETVIDAPAQVTSAPDGNVQYDFRPEDVAETGTFQMWWLVTYPGGATMKVPQAGYDTLIIET